MQLPSASHAQHGFVLSNEGPAVYECIFNAQYLLKIRAAVGSDHVIAGQAAELMAAKLTEASEDDDSKLCVSPVLSF